MLRGRANSWTDGLLERFRLGDRAIVPAHWPTEILNGLLVAARRKRIKPDQPAMLWDELARLAIKTEPSLTAVQATTVLALAERHGLTIYDAAYLELAHRLQLPLGSLDADLRKAAQVEGLPLL